MEKRLLKVSRQNVHAWDYGYNLLNSYGSMLLVYDILVNEYKCFWFMIHSWMNISQFVRIEAVVQLIPIKYSKLTNVE